MKKLYAVAWRTHSALFVALMTCSCCESEGDLAKVRELELSLNSAENQEAALDVRIALLKQQLADMLDMRKVVSQEKLAEIEEYEESLASVDPVRVQDLINMINLQGQVIDELHSEIDRLRENE